MSENLLLKYEEEILYNKFWMLVITNIKKQAQKLDTTTISHLQRYTNPLIVLQSGSSISWDKLVTCSVLSVPADPCTNTVEAATPEIRLF